MEKNSTLKKAFIKATPQIVAALKAAGYNRRDTSEIVLRLDANIHAEQSYVVRTTHTSEETIQKLQDVSTGQLKVKNFILDQFVWSRTPEGHSYWGAIYDALSNPKKKFWTLMKKSTLLAILAILLTIAVCISLSACTTTKNSTRKPAITNATKGNFDALRNKSCVGRR